jgi:invasion protein IalB
MSKPSPRTGTALFAIAFASIAALAPPATGQQVPPPPAPTGQPAQTQAPPAQPPARSPARASQGGGQTQPAAAGQSAVAPAVAPPAAPAPAQAASGLAVLDRGWRVVCQSPANNRNLMQCNVIFEAFRENGQRLLAIELVREGADQRILLTTPLGVNLLSPPEIVVDRGAPQRATYQTCQTGGCVALAPRGVDPASLARAGELEIRYETAGQKIGIPIPLAGFGAAMKRAD